MSVYIFHPIPVSVGSNPISRSEYILCVSRAGVAQWQSGEISFTKRWYKDKSIQL